MASVRGKLSRILVGLSLITFLAGISARGLCFMTTARGGTGQDAASEHDCCKTGLQTVPPGCCMSSIAADSPGRIAKKYDSPGPTVGAVKSQPWRVAVATSQNRPLLCMRGELHLAGPPPLVLRI